MIETTEREYRQSSSAPAPVGDAPFDALDILVVMARRRRVVLACVLAGAVAGIVLVLLLKPNFTAKATILPPQQQSSTAGLLNQLGSLASLSGGASTLGLKTPADLYAGMLASRTIADELIATYGLQNIYQRGTLLETQAYLKRRTSIEVGKDGLIEIAVTDHDPQRASNLANAYIEGLNHLNSSLAISEAAQRRLFFDQQLDTERKALASAEEDLQSTQQKTGLIQINGQAQAIIQSIEELRAELDSREVQLQSLRSFATDQNPKVVRLQSEIGEMRSQLSRMENDQKEQALPGDIAVPTGNLPKDSLEYTRRLRAVKYHESLFELLSKQEAAARIDEARSAPIIQVVDRAIPPDKRSGPPRALIILGLSIAGLMIGAGLAFADFALYRLNRLPHQRQKLENLRSELRRL